MTGAGDNVGICVGICVGVGVGVGVGVDIEAGFLGAAQAASRAGKTCLTTMNSKPAATAKCTPSLVFNTLPAALVAQLR